MFGELNNSTASHTVITHRTHLEPSTHSMTIILSLDRPPSASPNTLGTYTFSFSSGVPSSKSAHRRAFSASWRKSVSSRICSETYLATKYTVVVSWWEIETVLFCSRAIRGDRHGHEIPVGFQTPCSSSWTGLCHFTSIGQKMTLIP